MKFISLFSGIDAASVAFNPLGWEATAFSEIEPFPCAVLKHHYPDVPNHGDITKFDWSVYKGQVDMVCGGSPCQSFSLAGLRKGLSDERGNLAFEFVKAIEAISPKWVLYENVPGILSSKDNAFGCLLAALSGCNVPLLPGTRDGKWSKSGVVSGQKYGLAWRILNAEFFGVPQRRRRVFVVGCAGDWRASAKCLFESESVQWNPKKSRPKGKGVTSILEAGARTGRSTTDVRCGIGISEPDDPMFTLQATKQHAVAYCAGVTTVDARNAFDRGDQQHLDRLIVQEIIAVRTNQSSANGCGIAEGVAYTLDSFNGQAICYDARGNGIGDVVPNLTGDHAGHISDYTPIVIEQNSPCSTPDVISLRAAKTPNTVVCVPVVKPNDHLEELVLNDQGGSMIDIGYGVAPTLRSNSKGHEPSIIQNMVVRRLTTTECARLQGFPDSYLNIEFRGKPACDGVKYKALGNSWAVPVVRWIVERINEIELEYTVL